MISLSIPSSLSLLLSLFRMADDSADIIVETEGENIALMSSPAEGEGDKEGDEEVTHSKGSH